MKKRWIPWGAMLLFSVCLPSLFGLDNRGARMLLALMLWFCFVLGALWRDWA